MEKERLKGTRKQKNQWKSWGPYLSDRQWGTVREDYSENGDAWNFFTHDHARSRAYRWGEDGLAGISDDQQRGKPRRGRKGVLLLPRQHSDALLHEIPLQVSAGGVSVCRTRGNEPP